MFRCSFPVLRQGLYIVAMFAGTLATAVPASAQQQQAHVHGHMTLDVAVDAQTITLAVESPLDSFLGFERAPRTDAERKRVADLVARIQSADSLFQPDPEGACKLSKVALSSAALGLGEKQDDEHGHDHADKKAHDHEHEHASIDIDIVFICTQATEARFIDVKLFDSYPRIRTVAAQVATPQGQFKHTLRKGTSRLNLSH